MMKSLQNFGFQKNVINELSMKKWILLPKLVISWVILDHLAQKYDSDIKTRSKRKLKILKSLKSKQRVSENERHITLKKTLLFSKIEAFEEWPWGQPKILFSPWKKDLVSYFKFISKSFFRPKISYFNPPYVYLPLFPTIWQVFWGRTIWRWK